MNAAYWDALKKFSALTLAPSLTPRRDRGHSWAEVLHLWEGGTYKRLPPLTEGGAPQIAGSLALANDARWSCNVSHHIPARLAATRTAIPV